MKPIGTYLPNGLPAPRKAEPTPLAPSATPGSLGANPRLRLDPVLRVVVAEFLDAAGKVRKSAPSEAQLRAYRMAQVTSAQTVKPPGGNP